MSFLKEENDQVPGELEFLFSENGNILSFGGRTSALTECVSGVRSCLGSVCFFFTLSDFSVRYIVFINVSIGTLRY